MRRLIGLTALMIGLGAGTASAQTVASIGMNGMDPASGKPAKQVVIFFHGYTQTGAAMKPLAEALAKRLPDAAFVFNDGPLDANKGKSWYILRGEDPTNTRGASKKIAVDTVANVSKGLKVSNENIVVVGFSQGGGVAFDAGSCSAPDVKAIVSLAGVLANGDCAVESGSKPTPVLIVHNDQDPVVKSSMIQEFQDQLTKDGYKSTLETVAGTTHYPAQDGITKAEDFIVAQLGGK